jgi:hypothetical protein
MTGDDPNAQVSIQFDGGEWLHGIGIYAEIQKKCPIPGWEEGLEEVWQ